MTTPTAHRQEPLVEFMPPDYGTISDLTLILWLFIRKDKMNILAAGYTCLISLMITFEVVYQYYHNWVDPIENISKHYKLVQLENLPFGVVKS